MSTSRRRGSNPLWTPYMFFNVKATITVDALISTGLFKPHANPCCRTLNHERFIINYCASSNLWHASNDKSDRCLFTLISFDEVFELCDSKTKMQLSYHLDYFTGQ